LTLLKRGLTAPQIAEIGNIWYKFAKMGYTTLSDLKKMKFGFGMEYQVNIHTDNYWRTFLL